MIINNSITYAHNNCYYCRGYARDAEHETTRRPDTVAAQVGDDFHWARYEKTTEGAA